MIEITNENKILSAKMFAFNGRKGSCASNITLYFSFFPHFHTRHGKYTNSHSKNNFKQK